MAFAPLRHRNYALVWAAGLISNIGTWMETVAVGDLVARSTGEAGWTALVAAAGFLHVVAEHGRHSVYGIASGRTPSEADYLMGKWVRAGFGTHNIDNCSRA